MLHIDFETRSRVNLLTAGSRRYAADPSTDVLMMAWAIDDSPVRLWLPSQAPLPGEIEDFIEDDGDVAAFNAGFEWDIWEHVMVPRGHSVVKVRPEQWYCVAAQSRANNLPGNLEDCARMLGGSHQKNHRGKALIKLFCIPDAYGNFNNADTHPLEWAEFCQYCIEDTASERDVNQNMRPLTDAERQDYLVCELINRRGMRIDRDLAQAAVAYAEEEQQDLLALIQQLTNGEVQKVRGPKITKWVFDSLTPDQQRHMHVYKGGVLKTTFDKDARRRLIEEPDLPDIVTQVIEAADDAQAASTAKFKAMAQRADPEDTRVRGAYIFNGASASGRYSARGLQPHNMPRKVLDNVEEVRALMVRGASRPEITEASGMNIMQTLKGLLRPGVVAAPGKIFVCGDWEQIEGRVCPWLAHGSEGPRVDRIAQAKLDIYADPSRDVYLETASDILHERITDKEDPRRQGYGKVPELSLQFGGGVGAFMGMARNYGVNLPEGEVKDIVTNWRRANVWAPVFWKTLFDAAVKACHEPMTPQPAGRVTYMYQPEFLNGSLWCMLPSGRTLCYPQARCVWQTDKFGKKSWQLSAAKAAWKPKQGEKTWPRNYLWPGLLCENVTQAVAADVLRECLYHMVMELDWPVVGHTHDEALLEVWKKYADFFAEQLDTAMTAGTDWSQGLPLAAEVWINPWYKK